MAIRGIRGAITVKVNSKAAILQATEKLINAIFDQNKVKMPSIACIIFTATGDLNAEFPAQAARKLGLNKTPLLCASEINVKGSLKKCLRVLVLFNGNQPQAKIKHVYLEGAKKLRPDL
jgi:chorismate mutase